jgi:hypothetical protein
VGRSAIEAERQKKVALDILLEAWDRALGEGVAPELLASTAIFAALADLVEAHGEDAVAEMLDALPARVRQGEFTLRKQA